jgi:hypothetical protein
MHYISYQLDIEDGEAHYQIYDDCRKLVYSEDVIGDWDGDRDVEMTGLEIARGKGYWPAAVIQDISEIPQTHKSISAKGGAAPHKRPPNYFSDIAKKPRKKAGK